MPLSGADVVDPPTSAFRVILASPLPTGSNTVGSLTATQGQPPWSQTLTDGDHGPVAVTPPFLAPSAADPALVVVLSPNGPVLPVSPRGMPATQVASAANTTVSIAPGRAVIGSVGAYCSAGSASLTITDSGTTVWSTPAATIVTALATFTWTVPLSFVGAGVVQLGACGAGNVGTLIVQAATLP